ncbi:MAG: cellulase family glycosylhydrolase, partial [Candidatus Cryptobacteroides sp.]
VAPFSITIWGKSTLLSTDVVGMDNYWLYRPECTDITPARTRLKVISDIARKHGKVAALTETGQNAIETHDWFSSRLLESIYGNPDDNISLAYVAFWRNSTMGYFTPYQGHPAMDDFLKFLSDPRVVLMDPYDWLGKWYHIVPNSKEYYVGTNFWYGAILGSPEGAPGSDRERLCRELDEMKSLGITNLRILVGADGADGIAVKVQPALQTAPGEYNENILEGLDYLLEQMDMRGMKAVLYINNSWEWSGGYGTYLEWAGKGKTPDTRTEGYNKYTEFVSQFMTCPQAQELFFNHVRFIVERYRDSNAIYSWQIGNEPRCFSSDPAVQDEFVKYVDKTSKLIKSIDSRHLVSIGNEGTCGCEGSLELYERINSCPEVDYITIHIWPYNWGWAREASLTEDVNNAIRNSDGYIDQALEVAERLGKDVVIEEFGFPRDNFAFRKGTPVTARDAYYSHIFARILSSKKTGGRLKGANFWGWGGYASQNPDHIYWESGDDYCGDPSQEQQGLNSVYSDDASTVNIIKHFNDELSKQY